MSESAPETPVEPLRTTGDYPFVVFDTRADRYVASVDVFDGEVDHCQSSNDARIFYGATWRDYWTLDRYRIESTATSKKEPEP